ncbi:nitroreductase family protein [Saccharibacillus sp. CPCC 101409]|uniref:nitroreductase family protein n=1 Tax=Saccharibacillus sp. CPCC 101409 TaxID=3058041 RepID=UPI002673EDD4|nr:nitroreductase family protein [Saccharibacillus sp. CPCC 101409]MDO3411108.1 nitroreductase family protein [Saccharibacillus sp. CPCC 101409]
MKPVPSNDFNAIMKGRRSIRAYRSDYRISREELTGIIRDAATAPSSGNLQPWRVVVVDSEEGKARLRPLVMFNTLQNDTSSAMLLIFGDHRQYENADFIFDTAVEQGKMPPEVRDRQLEAIKPHYAALTREQSNDIVKVDSALFAMQLMLAARARGYDTNPIGGFEADKLAEAFDLDPQRYAPVMILALGKAEETGYESVRLEPERITFWR